MTIKSRILALALGVILSVASTAYVGYRASRTLVLEQIQSLGKAVSQVAAEEGKVFFIEREAFLIAVLGGIDQAMREKGSFDVDEAFTLMKYWMKRAEELKINTLFLVTTDNKMYDTYDWVVPEGYVPIEQSWYVDTINAEGITYSSPYVDEETGAFLILTIGSAVKGLDGKPLGVLAMDIRLNDLDQFVATRNIDGEGYGLMIAPDGLLTSHPNKQMEMQINLSEESDLISHELAQLGREMREGKSGSGRYILNGTLNEMFYQPMAVGWSLGVVVPVDRLMAPARALAVKQALIGVFCVFILCGLLYSVYRSVVWPLGKFVSVMTAVKNGDMTLRTGFVGRDELSEAARTVDNLVSDQGEFLQELRAQSLEIDRNTQELEGAFDDAGEMARTIADHARALASVATKNESVVEGVNASIEEMSGSSAVAANAAVSVSSEAKSLRKNAIDSEEMLRRNTLKVADMAKAFESVAKAIRELDAKAGSINNIVATITGIADQTNLLALNAAIEAARAGEAGRGFAVVAEEVRKLAEESNVAARKIGDLAGSIVKETKSAVDSATDGVSIAGTTTEETHATQTRLTEVISAVSRIVEQIQNVATTAQEQSVSLQEMNGAVEQVTKGASENREKTEQISELVEGISMRLKEIVGTTSTLRGMVASNNERLSRYKLEDDGIAPMLLSLRGARDTQKTQNSRTIPRKHI